MMRNLSQRFLSSFASIAICFLAQASFAVTPFRNDSLTTQQGPYTRIFGGVTGIQNDGEAFGVVPIKKAEKLDVEYDKGYKAGAAIGYQYGPLRIEESFFATRNNVDNIEQNLGNKITNPDASNADGSVKGRFAMTNLYYDWMTGTRLTPFIGVGVGAGRLTYDASGNLPNIISQQLSETPPSFSHDDSYNSFAYQGIIGFDVALSGAVSINLTYNYLGTPSHSYNVTATPNIGASKTSSISQHFEQQSLNLGVTIHFA